MTIDSREELASIKRAITITGISKSNIYRRIREGSFPKPIQVGGRSLWPVSYLHNWVRRQIEGDQLGANTE